MNESFTVEDSSCNEEKNTDYESFLIRPEDTVVTFSLYTPKLQRDVTGKSIWVIIFLPTFTRKF